MIVMTPFLPPLRLLPPALWKGTSKNALSSAHHLHPLLARVISDERFNVCKYDYTPFNDVLYEYDHLTRVISSKRAHSGAQAPSISANAISLASAMEGCAGDG